MAGAALKAMKEGERGVLGIIPVARESEFLEGNAHTQDKPRKKLQVSANYSQEDNRIHVALTNGNAKAGRLHHSGKKIVGLAYRESSRKDYGTWSCYLLLQQDGTIASEPLEVHGEYTLKFHTTDDKEHRVKIEIEQTPWLNGLYSQPVPIQLGLDAEKNRLAVTYTCQFPIKSLEIFGPDGLII
ncbi:MAG: hypothetical protein WC717_01990, partial [Candidatus Micrarchaeia archaeon]